MHQKYQRCTSVVGLFTRPFFITFQLEIKQVAVIFHRRTEALISIQYPSMAAMMRLPVDHHHHCILSLLIMPHNANPDYELPLLQKHSPPFVVADVCLLLIYHQEFKSARVYISQRNPLYLFRELQERQRSPHCLFLLPCNTPRCVCCQKQKDDIAFIFFFLCCFKNQASISTCLKFCNKIQSNNVLFEIAAFVQLLRTYFPCNTVTLLIFSKYKQQRQAGRAFLNQLGC